MDGFERAMLKRACQAAGFEPRVGAHYWVAFRATRTSWVRVKFKRGCCRANPRFAAGIAIRHAGREIIVTEPVYASDDPACPSLGTKTGTWRWLRTSLGLLDVTREP